MPLADVLVDEHGALIIIVGIRKEATIGGCGLSRGIHIACSGVPEQILRFRCVARAFCAIVRRGTAFGMAWPAVIEQG
jgi:hypothetical protein